MPAPFIGTHRLSLAALLLAVSFLAGACSRDGDGERKTAAPVPLVEAVAARSGSLPLVERLSGLVEARGQVSVRAEIEGRVVEVLVRNGEPVEVGQPLVRLDDSTLRERLNQADAGVRVAEAIARSAQARVAELAARVSRSRLLAEQQLIPDVDLETLEAQVDAAEANADEESARVEEARSLVEERRSALARATVRSPVAGRVGQRDVEVGMLVDAGSALFQVGDTDRVIVEVSLTEDMLAYLREGQTVHLIPGRERSGDAGSGPITAEIARISPFLSEGSFSTVAEIDIDHAGGRLRPGMFVTVDVLYGETEQATLVPSSALWEDPQSGSRRVFVLGGSEAPAEGSESTPRAVEMRAGVEILAEGRGVVGLRGVESGEWVVTLGQHLIGEDKGAMVRVRGADWDQVQSLQSLQRDDLLAQHMAKQRRLAESVGATPPSNKEYMSFDRTPADAGGSGGEG